jgi:signal peptidase II
VSNAVPRRMPPWITMAVVAVVVVAVDQLTKWWAVERLSEGPIDVVWTLRFSLVRNEASAFSIGGGSWWGPLVSVVALAVIVVLAWQARSATSRWVAVAAGLVAGGAFGNLIDRAARSDRGMLRGGVVDFVDFQWWPVFNVADAAVVVGVLVLLATTLGLGSPARPDPESATTRDQPGDA